MGTKDFITTQRVDKPRHDQNMPEDVETPVPGAWYASRPGDSLILDDTGNPLLGNTGPGGGFALTLVAKAKSHINLLPHEHFHDVEPLIAEIAMKRASYFTRSPMMPDVKFALKLLNYDSKESKGEEAWRVALVHDCGHDEHKRRRIVNSIPESALQSNVEDVENHVDLWWRDLQKFL